MSQSLAAADTAAGRVAELDLTGDLARPARLTVPDLLAWPQHEADVSFEWATSGIHHHRFTGPLLHEVLSAAAPVFDSARRKDRLRFLFAVSGRPAAGRVLGRGLQRGPGRPHPRPDGCPARMGPRDRARRGPAALPPSGHVERAACHGRPLDPADLLAEENLRPALHATGWDLTC